MVAIADIKKTLTQESHLIGQSIDSEEVIIDDESLDYALNCTKSINKINDIFIRVFDGLEELSTLKIEEDTDEDDIREVLKELRGANSKSIALWISFNNDNFLKIACKSVFLDLRINIRMMKEYIEDIHNKFFLKDKHVTKMGNLFESL